MLCLAVALYCAAPTLAEQPGNHARGGVSLGARVGNDTGEGFVDFVVPLHSNSQSILFLNPRASLKDEGETELNLGLVARKKIPNTDLILGANAYLDRRESRHGNTFNQTGLGIEALGKWVDARLNYYHPNDDRVMIADAQMTGVDVDTSTSSSVSRQSDTEMNTSLLDSSTSGGDPRYAGNSILTGGAVTENALLNTTTTTTRTTTTTTRTIRTTTTDRFFEQFEQGREGWDAELMLRMPLPDRFPQTRLGMGYYDYSSGFNGGQGISGVKGRLEMRAGPYLTLDAEVFEDRELNDTSFFLGARLHLPFDMGRLVNGRNPFRNIRNQIRRQNLAPINERLDEMVMRDVRIQMEESEFLENRTRLRQDVEVEVETSTSSSTSTTTEESVVTETSTEPTETITQDGEVVTVVHVDDDNSADPDNDPGADGGTYENPHANATDTNNDTTDDVDIILVHASSSINGAIQADSETRVLGEGDGAVHFVAADQGQIALPETAPDAQGDPRPTVDGVSISSQNVEVSNFTVNNGSISTAAGSTHRDIIIRRISSTGNASDSVISLGAGGSLDENITLSDINIAGHTGGLSAISIQNSLATAQVTGTEINVSGPGSNGLFLGGAAAGSSHVFSIVDISGTGGGINIAGSDGDYTFGDTTVTNPTGTAFQLNGGSANVGFTAASSINQGSNQTALGVTGGHDGSLVFDGAITATNGDGLQFDNAGGLYGFNGNVVLNGGDAGVDILGGSAGTFDFADTHITNPSGPAYNEDNSTANVMFQAGSDISQSNDASAVRVNNKTGGATVFNGPVTADTGTAAGIELTNNTGGTVTFNGGLDINTTTGNGFNASGGGTVNVLNGTNSNSIATTETAAGAGDGGAALALSGVSGSLAFNTVSADGSAGAGIDIDNLGDGSTLAIGTTTITDADPGAGTGALTVRNNAGTVNLNFGDTTIADTNIGGGVSGNGLFITGNGAATTSTFGDLSITTDNGAGITHNDGSALTVTGTTTIDANSPGLNLQNSSGTFDFADLNIDFTGASRGIDFRNSSVIFDADNTTITGDGAAGGIGIDLSGSMNPNGPNSNASNIRLADGAGQTAIIDNVETGVMLGDGAGSAGAYFVYGNQSEPDSGSEINVVSGGTTLDTSNLISDDPFTQGRYEFLGVAFTGEASFEQASDFYFVASTATGAGDGSSVDDRAEAATFLSDLTASNLAGITVIGINDGGDIDFGANTAGLNSLTNIDGFGNGNSIDVFTVPVNLIVSETNLENAPTVIDPTGNGAATFTTDAGSDVFDLSDSHTISNVNINGGDFNIAGTGFQDLTVQGVGLGGGDSGVFSFTDTTGGGTIQLTDNTISQDGGRLLQVDGGNSVISLTAGTGSITNTDGSGIDIRNTTGGSVMIDGASITSADSTPLTFDNNDAAFSLTNNTISTDAGVTLLDVDTTTGGSTAALTFDGGNSFTHTSGMIADIGAGGRDIDLSAHDFTNTGTTATSVIDSTGQTGGTIAFGNVDVTGFNNAAGTAVNLQGTGGTVTFGDLDITTTSGAGLDVGGITFDPGASPTIDAAGANALTMNGTALNGGAATFDSVASSDGVNGIDIDNTTGTLTLTTVDIDDSTGDGISLDNADTVMINGGTIDGTAGDGVNSANSNLTVDGVALGGTTQIGGDGIQVVNTANSSVALNNTTINATDAGITVDGSGGGTTTVTSLSGNMITSAGAGGILFDTVTFDATPGGGTTIGSLGNRVQGDGLSLSNVFGTLSFDDLDIANNNGTGILVQNSKTNSFTLNVDAGDASNATVDTTNGTAIDLDPLTVNANFATVNASGATAGSAVNIDTVNGTFNIDGGSLANSNSGSAVVNIESSSADVAIGASISNLGGSGGNSVTASANTGGTYVFSGNIDDDASGIDVTNNTGGTFTFSGASKSLTTGANNAVQITGNSAGATINFTSGGLGIDTTSGAGFNATGGGTVNVTGSGNIIDTTTGTGVNIANTTIGSSGVTFDSISVNGAANGIVLNNTGSSGGFTVTGDGSMTGGVLDRDGSGGTLITTGDAVALTNATNVTLRQMDIPGAGADAIHSTGGETFTFSALEITSPTGDGWEATDLTGNNRIDHNTLISGIDNAGTSGVHVSNTDVDLAGLTLDGSTFNNSTGGQGMVVMRGLGTSNMVLNVTDDDTADAFNSVFENLNQSAIVISAGTDAGSTSTITTNINDTAFRNGPAGGFNNVEIQALENGTANFDISGNTFENLDPPGANSGIILLQATGSGTLGAASGANGTIANNTFTGINGRRGIHLTSNNNASGHNVIISGNTFEDLEREALFVSARDNTIDFDLLVENNTFGTATNPVGNTDREAVEILSENSAVLDVQFTNNLLVNSSGTGFSQSLRLASLDDAVLNIQATENDFRTSGTNTAFSAETSLGGTSTMCLDLAGNDAFSSTGTSGGGTYTLSENTGTFNVVDRDNTDTNNAGTVTFSPGIGSFGNVGSCPAPDL